MRGDVVRAPKQSLGVTMIVEPSHRAETAVYDRDVYESTCQRLVRSVSALPNVASIVVCGSLIKDTLVPGWSDLDLVVFLEPAARSLASLKQIRGALKDGKGDIRIGIGIDLVYVDAFERSRRFGGRPLAMTFEVAGYGQVAFGPNPFEHLSLGDEIRKSIEYDRVQSIRAELHNWRRTFVGTEAASIPSLQRSTKTLLKLLKHETDPAIRGPYTYDAAYERAVNLHLPPTNLQLFRHAVDFRKNWLTLIAHADDVAAASELLEAGLAGYFEEAPK